MRADRRDQSRLPGRSLLDERLVPIPEVPDILPTRRGKKLHISTVYRWVLKGARGRVLESALLGGVRYTSREALQRFMETTVGDPEEQRRAARLRSALAERGLLGRDANKRERR